MKLKVRGLTKSTPTATCHNLLFSGRQFRKTSKRVKPARTKFAIIKHLQQNSHQKWTTWNLWKMEKKILRKKIRETETKCIATLVLLIYYHCIMYSWAKIIKTVLNLQMTIVVRIVHI